MDNTGLQLKMDELRIVENVTRIMKKKRVKRGYLPEQKSLRLVTWWFVVCVFWIQKLRNEFLLCASGLSDTNGRWEKLRGLAEYVVRRGCRKLWLLESLLILYSYQCERVFMIFV